MKKLFVIPVLAFLGLLACQQKISKEKENVVIVNDTAAVIAFEEETYDFGTMNQGDTVKHTFKFKNTGGKPLIIDNATASCGCTVPTWTKTPIKPGESGELIAVFNSAHKEGKQNKTITVYANSVPPFNTISFTAEVLVPKKVEESKEKK